ncbi:CmNV_076-like protein [Aratus pisonii nudivirus]|nr:CmNV_076-like protein [Aratus pisonii nudivirus]
MKIDDTQLSSFINNVKFDEKFINEVDLSTIQLHKKSLFYWYNVVQYENIAQHEKNIIYLENLGKNFTSISALLFHMFVNLETILSKIDARNMIKWVIPLNKLNGSLKVKQNINNININKYLCNTNTNKTIENNEISVFLDTLPILKHENSLFISKLLNICLLKTYYPIDLQPYPVQRAFMYNMTMMMNIDIENQNDPIVKDMNTFLTKMITEIDYDLYMKILNNLNVHNTENILLESLWGSFTRAYFKIKEVTPSAYSKVMDVFEQSIIPGISKKFNIEINEISNFKALKESYCKKVKYCDSSVIDNNVIVKVLKNYDMFITNDKIDIINTLNLCPIQVTFILHLFPFYKYHYLTVDNNYIVHEHLDNTSDDKTVMSKFKNIKELIKFNGNYEDFKNTVHLFNLTYEEVLLYLNAYFENRGFQCSVIIAELIKHHLNIDIDTMSMYLLISKLTTSEILSIEKSKPCFVSYVNKSNDEVLLEIIKPINVYMKYLEFTHLKTIVDKMSTMYDFDQKINLASKTNFNVVPLIIYLNNNKEDIENIKYLILFSSAPNKLKNFIYSSLPNKHLKTLPGKEFENDILNMPDTSTLDNSDVDKSLNLFLYTNCLSLLDQYKNTKNDKLLIIINKIVQDEDF